MEAAAQTKFDFADVLTRMTEERASDVHLSPGFPPAMRVRGKIVPLEEYGKLSPQATRDVVYSLLNDDQRKRFESNKQLDLAYAVPGVARFRVNCFFQRGSISAALTFLTRFGVSGSPRSWTSGLWVSMSSLTFVPAA